MDRLIEDCRLDCPPEGQIKVVDRCLQVLTTPTEDFEKKEIVWLLLARILEKCSAECLRASQVRLGKRLLDIAEGPTLCSAIFVRQLLNRNPQTAELHASTVEKIILTLLDRSTKQQDSDLKNITCEIFALRYGCSMCNVVIATLEVLLRQKFIGPDERKGLLNIACLGMSQYMEPLSIYLFQLLAVTFEYSKRGDIIDRDKFLTVIELGIASAVHRDFALRALQIFCRTAKKAALSVVPLISSLLISQLKTPSAALFATLTELSSQYGVGSNLYKHLYVIFEVMRHPLDEQDYGIEAGALLSSIIETSSYLIQPEVLTAVQQLICRQYAYYPFSPIYRSLMVSFLLGGHPLIPPPVQIARSIVKNYPNERISSICEVMCRPRLLNLDVNRVMEKAATFKHKGTNEAAAQENYVQEADSYANEVKKVMEEISKATATTITSSVEVAVIEEQPTSSKAMDELTQVKKHPVLEMTSSTIIKKPKKPEPQTVLHEGEQSVDEILESFVM